MFVVIFHKSSSQSVQKDSTSIIYLNWRGVFTVIVGIVSYVSVSICQVLIVLYLII